MVGEDHWKVVMPTLLLTFAWVSIHLSVFNLGIRKVEGRVKIPQKKKILCLAEVKLIDKMKYNLEFHHIFHYMLFIVPSVSAVV